MLLIFLAAFAKGWYKIANAHGIRITNAKLVSADDEVSHVELNFMRVFGGPREETVFTVINITFFIIKLKLDKLNMHDNSNELSRKN